MRNISDDMNTTYRYVIFELEQYIDNAWVCMSKHSDILGHVRYYPPWKQYCFNPSPLAIFSSSCLASIQDFLRQVNKK